MRVIVVGNGTAGNSVAFTIRKLCNDADIRIFSEEVFPEYSPCVLTNYVAGDIERESVFLKSIESYHKHNINVYLGEKISKVNPENKMVFSKTKEISYDSLVIATGSRVILPEIKGIKKRGVFVLKSLADADGICSYRGKTAVVVGSGPIGLETGIALRQRGIEVSVVELENQILPRVFDNESSLLLRRILEDRGIKVYTGERALEIIGDSKVTGLSTDKQNISCDIVILATGVVPEVELAMASGLEIGESGGIVTDQRMMTSARNIYACGDCIEVRDTITDQKRLSLKWYDARLQAIVAAYNIAGIHTEYPGSINITNLNVFDTHAVSIGATGEMMGKENIRVIERAYDRGYLRLLCSNNTVVGAQLINGTRYASMLSSLIRRRDDLEEVRNLVINRNVASIPLMTVLTNPLIRETVLT